VPCLEPTRGISEHGGACLQEGGRSTLPLCPDQLQEELDGRVQAWEQEHEGAFLVKGQQFMEYVMEQWQLFRLEKEKEKQERVSAEPSVLSPGLEEPLRHRTPAVPCAGGNCPSRCPGLAAFSLSHEEQLGVSSASGSGTGVHCCRCLGGLSPGCALPALPWQRAGSAQPALPCSSARVCERRSLLQHLKKSRQIETEMMYGSTPRTPVKRRVLGPHTPGKVRKVKLAGQRRCAGPRVLGWDPAGS